jgi:cytochrome c biogenesis protein CcdA
MSLFLLAILGGSVSVFVPSFLPLLPMLLAVSAPGSTLRPRLVFFWFPVSFGLSGGLFASAQESFVGVQSILRSIATIILVVYAIHFIRWHVRHHAQHRQETASMPLGQSQPKETASRLLSFAVGLAMGIVWMPATGPILGTIVVLSNAMHHVLFALPLYFAYAFGAILSLSLARLILSHILKAVDTRTHIHHWLAWGIGILVILSSLGIFFGLDHELQAVLLLSYPPHWFPV